MAQEIVPFRQFVLKVHSRCDLACNHCYIYEHQDQSWRGRPRDGISPETAALAARRIAEHAKTHRLSEVHVILHGGEPLLLGVSRTRQVAEILRREISPVTSLVLRMHTNAVLLNREYLDLLVEYDVKVGVSLDGGKAANDLHRLDRRGQSSYDRVIAALQLLRSPEYRHLYSGLLCTIDLQNDPVEAYLALLEQEPPRIDFLLPHATWEHQPFGLSSRREIVAPKAGPTPYADWLGKIFSLWGDTGRPVPIRTFDSVVAALHGRPSGTESLGLEPAEMLVIETDGTLEQADSLKTAFDSAPATGFDVEHNSLDEAAAHTGIVARQLGLDGLSEACRACPVVRICGGGLYAHRYTTGSSGFDNPSVYCGDLFDLIGRISAAEGTFAAEPDQNARGREQAPAVIHTLSPSHFDAIAAGYGDAAAIRSLADIQLSIRRNLLSQFGSVGPQDDRSFTAAWDRLAELDEVNPQAVGRILAEPFVREWAVRCLQNPTAGRDTGDVAYLASIAASAHLSAGLTTSLSLPVRDGIVHLPGYGALYVAQSGPELAIETLPDLFVAMPADGRTSKVDMMSESADAQWQPLRRIEAGGVSVVLEDLGPYRDCGQAAAPRLSAAEFGRWRAAFPEAIAFIDEHLPRYAPALRAGLTTLVPQSASTDGAVPRATSRNAFGALAVALPEDPVMLALQLVRGFQHAKLGALLDMFDLYDVADSEAPSLPSLFTETYAAVAEIEFWRARARTLSGDQAQEAEAQFSRKHSYVAGSLPRLAESGLLTPLGAQIVRALEENLVAQ